ncbi:hypothetical protein JYT51_01530 [Candidatus Amoebophilus asiaticus]|nr:hypothetical protein [Candidatus Amoebophilus asiaticus]
MRHLLYLIILVCCYSLKAQPKSNTHFFETAEDTLRVLADSILNGENSISRQAAIYHFDKILKKVLEKEGSFEYPFDSLDKISILEPKNHSFRIFTWHLLKDDLTYKHYGYIQAKNKDNTILYKLIDNSHQITKPEDSILNYRNWYGAHYYTLLENKHKRKKYFTLLGWDGNNRFTTKKLIETLTFNENCEPVFGAPIINAKDGITNTRLIFEYDAQAVMLLRYDKKKKMIIYDHLSPQKPEYEGIYLFYGPDFTYDGLKFKKGKWQLVEHLKLKN